MIELKHTKKQKPKQIKKRAMFTYVGWQTKFITKLYKTSDLKTPFKADNTIGKLLAHYKNTNFNKYNKSGVYQLTCQDCSKKYIGQTSRLFHVKFQEHFRDFKYKNGKSNFAQHLTDKGHSISPMEDVMEILHVTKKGNMINTLKKFHTYNTTRLNNQVNEKDLVKHNVIFDLIANIYTTL